jgi:hypothetical protein
VAVEAPKEVWARSDVVFQALFTTPGSPGSNSLRIKLSLGGSDVVLVSFKATVLTKISDHPAPTEGATWAVSDDLFDLVEGLGCAGSLLGHQLSDVASQT